MMKKKVVLISGHYFLSKRKAGFHMLAETYANAGHDVLFVTAPYSFLFKLKRHYFNELEIVPNKIVKASEHISYFVHSTPFHVANFKLKWLNYISRGLYRLYQYFSMGKAERSIKDADQIIFESTPGLFLFERVKRLNKKARFVYRVSDDLELLNVHPSLLHYEKRILPDFDLVSVASTYVFNKLKSKSPGAHIKLHFHGIKKEVFDKEDRNPYEQGKINALFIGVSNLDYEILQRASEYRKDVIFHIIGPFEKKVVAKNIVYYGEMPYYETIPYIKNASIALHTITYYKGAESLGESSLKSIQYAYCNLPIVAPYFLKNPNRNLFIYNNPREIGKVLNNAITSVSSGIKQKENKVYTWEALMTMLDQ